METMRALFVPILFALGMSKVSQAKENHELSVFPLPASSTGILFLNIGSTISNKAPELIFLYDLAAMMSDISQADQECNQLIKLLKIPADTWERNCKDIKRIEIQLHHLLKDLHVTYNLNENNEKENELWTKPDYQMIPNSNFEGYYNDKVTYWHKTKYLKVQLQEMLFDFSNLISETNFSNLTSETQIKFEDLTNKLKINLAYFQNIIDEIIGIFSLKLFQPSTNNVIIQTSTNYYLKLFPKVLSLEGKRHLIWKKKIHYLRNGILIVKFDFPFNLKAPKSNLYLPIHIPLNISENSLFEVKGKFNLEVDSKLILETSGGFYSFIKSDQLLDFQGAGSNTYFIEPTAFVSESKSSCNLNAFLENIDSSELSCTFNKIDPADSNQLIQFGKSKIFYYYAYFPEIINYKCNHLIKHKTISGPGLLKLSKNCSLTKNPAFTRSSNNINDYTFVIPEYVNSIYTYYYTENFVLKFLTNAEKGLYLIKRMNLVQKWISLKDRFLQFLNKNHFHIMRINAVMFVTLLCILLALVYNNKRNLANTEDETDRETTYRRPLSSLFRGFSLGSLHAIEANIASPDNSLQPPFTPASAQTLLESFSLSDSRSQIPAESTFSPLPRSLVTIEPLFSTLASIQEENETNSD
jgi:hypothetical protein